MRTQKKEKDAGPQKGKVTSKQHSLKKPLLYRGF